MLALYVLDSSNSPKGGHLSKYKSLKRQDIGHFFELCSPKTPNLKYSLFKFLL